MKHVIVSCKDVVAGMFMRPSFSPAAAVAVRGFRDEVNRRAEDNMLFRHPGDFELYELGTFDDVEGKFELAIPRLLVRARDLVEEGGSAQPG